MVGVVGVSTASGRQAELDGNHQDSVRSVLRGSSGWWDRVLRQANARARARVQQDLQYWQADDDRAGLREPDALAKLPPDERAERLAFWKEVAAVIGRARATP